MDFGRVITAMVTPFNHDKNIDYQQLELLIDYLLDNGSEGLVVGGTTGESPTLSMYEKMDLYQYVVQYVNKRVPVIAGTGSNNTKESINLTKQVESLGVDGVLLVTPYYNKPNQEGLYQHFSTIAKETSLPIMLYNIPGRSVVNMNAETIIRLSQIDNIISVKEAGIDLDQISEIIENTPDHFTVYSGNDGLTLPMLSIGAHGVVSVASHIIGNEMKEMIDHSLNGNISAAATLHRNLLPVMNGLFASPSPAPVKAALELINVDVGGVRLPLIDIDAEERTKLKQLLENIG